MGQVAGTDEEEALAATTCTLTSVRERPGRHWSARVTLALCAQGSPGSCEVAAGSGTCQYVPLVAGGTDTIRDDLQKVLHATSPLLDAAHDAAVRVATAGPGLQCGVLRAAGDCHCGGDQRLFTGCAWLSQHGFIC